MAPANADPGSVDPTGFPDCRTCPLGAATRGACSFSRLERRAGSIQWAQGDTPSGLVWVRRGHLTLAAVDADGEVASFLVKGPRSLLGVEGLFGRPAAAEVRTLTDVALCRLDPDKARQWLGEATPAWAVLRHVLDDRGRFGEADESSRVSCLRRVARLLAGDGALLGDAGRSGLTKEQAARLLRMRPETFSRCLRRLALGGYVDARRGVRVLDPAGLERLAAGDPPGRGRGRRERPERLTPHR